MTIDPVQWLTAGGFVVLMGVCLWACRAAPSLRPWALAVFLWAANGTAFYVWYLGFNRGVIDGTVVFWSTLTRLHSILMAGGGLWIAVVRIRNGNHG